MDFTRDVIERSHHQPVVVDFWAPWCGPCRVLGPVIEKLAEENKGKWDLVKVNTEEQQELAIQYRIRSIPNVKMFFRGEVVAEFMGALPRPQIQQWLNQHLPKKEELALEELLKSAPAWPKRGLKTALETFISKNPDHREAMLTYAQEIVLEEPEKALDSISEQQHTDGYEDIRALKELLTGDFANQGVAANYLSTAAGHLRARDLESTLKAIISAAAEDKDFSEELPRRAGVAIFRITGNDHPLSRAYRRNFNMMLSV